MTLSPSLSVCVFVCVCVWGWVGVKCVCMCVHAMLLCSLSRHGAVHTLETLAENLHKRLGQISREREGE